MFQIFVAKQHYFVPSPLVNVFQYRLHICHHHHRLRIRRFQKKITKMTFFDKLIQFTFFMSQFYANFASYNGKVSNNLTLPFSIISHRQQIPTTYLPTSLPTYATKGAAGLGEDNDVDDDLPRTCRRIKRETK